MENAERTDAVAGELQQRADDWSQSRGFVFGQHVPFSVHAPFAACSMERDQGAKEEGLGVEISLAYAITIHKSQGSEFPAVVIPLATQHYMLLQRNLIYTGITRCKRLLVLIGQKKALGIAVRNDRPQRRYSGLLASLKNSKRSALA